MVAREYRDYVLSKIDRLFSYKDGLLVECMSNPKDEPKILICVGTAENPQFPQPPQSCWIWRDEDLIYDGSLRDCATIAHILRQNKICLFNFTTTIRIEKRSKRFGYVMCQGDYENCPYRSKCPCREEKETGTEEL